MLYFSHYLINSFKFTTDKIMGEVQHQFWEIKMVLKTKNTCKKKLRKDLG